MSTKRKCIKNFVHEFETVEQTSTHIIKQCTRCRIRTYKARGFTATNPRTPIPLRA